MDVSRPSLWHLSEPAQPSLTFNMERPRSISRYNVANRLSKRSLLIAINCIAGLSIFFFGYDQ